MTLISAWAAFAGCLILILYSGTRLSRYGNLISVRTGLGGAWVGVVLVASVTSLPELVTGISSVLVVGEPDLAVGAVLGSCVFNLLIIVILDTIYRPKSLFTQIHQGQVLSAGFGVVLIGTVAASIVIHQAMPGKLGLGPIGPFALVGLLIYAVAMRSVFYYEKRQREEYVGERAEVAEGDGDRPDLSLRQIYLLYAFNSLVVVGAAIALPAVGEEISHLMGWDRTFVGTVLLAFVTSVPEIVISVEAVRINAVDMAIGNLLGSNLFDILVMTINDFVYVDGPILSVASPEHLFTALTAMTMTGVVVVSLTYRPKRKVFRTVTWASLALLSLALVNALVLFLLT